MVPPVVPVLVEVEPKPPTPPMLPTLPAPLTPPPAALPPTTLPPLVAPPAPIPLPEEVVTPPLTTPLPMPVAGAVLVVEVVVDGGASAVVWIWLFVAAEPSTRRVTPPVRLIEPPEIRSNRPRFTRSTGSTSLPLKSFGAAWASLRLASSALPEPPTTRVRICDPTVVPLKTSSSAPLGSTVVPSRMPAPSTRTST